MPLPAFSLASPAERPPHARAPAAPRRRPLCARRPLACLGGAAAQPGTTYLVGSGPGGAEHLTLRAARLIRTADVLVVDALADPAILSLARADARVVHVGKRGGAAGSAAQADISALLASLARASPPQAVVRLKAGDPGLFGRASEELGALARARAPVRVVPGVSSVSAAGAAVSRSLTSRARGRSVALVSGHDPAALDYAALAAMDTVALLMAGRHVGVILARLADADAAAGGTRGACYAVQWALREGRQRVVEGRVGELAARVARELPDGLSPAVVLVFREDEEEGDE